MKEIILKLLRLFTGLFLYALGIVMTINANLGLSPWDVFHQGLSRTTGITMGQASIGVGLIIVILNFVFNERVGIGTICNMIFIGIFLDILMLNHIVPEAHSILAGVMLMISGMLVIGLATFLYIGAEFGSGPRDGLMVALTKRTGKSVRLVRSIIEISVLLIGYLLGGFVGIGTLLMAFMVGPSVQFVFKIFKFDVGTIKHRFIDDDIKLLREKFLKREDNEEGDCAQ